LGTIADCQILQGENRVFVKKGMLALKQTKNIGLQALMKVAGIDVSALDIYNISFGIAPRINASGRMENPRLAFDLLNTDDLQTAEALALELNRLNTYRQELTKQMMEEAGKQITNYQLLITNEGQDLKTADGKGVDAKEQETISNDGTEEQKQLPKLLILKQDDWHHGIIGLISGKICEQFCRPVISFEKRGDVYVASARSISGYHITDALSEFSHLLIKYGGHAEAAGFSVHQDNYEKFCELLVEHCNLNLTDEHLVPSLNIDCHLPSEDINKRTLEIIEKLQPYGIGNPSPIFTTEGTIKNMFKMGKNKEHLKMSIDVGIKKPVVVETVWFGYDYEPMIGDKVKIAFELARNIWQGNETIQLKVADMIDLKDKNSKF
jgi:single-stranded-DNA-specific exonuclease